MKKKPIVILNVISNWFALLVSIASGFLLVPIEISYIGKTSFGIWTLIISFIGYFGIFETAFMPAVTHFIALYIGKKSSESLKETSSTALASFSLIGIIVILLAFFLAEPLADLMNIESSYRTVFINLIKILGISAGLKFPISVFGAFLRAHEQWIAHNFSIIARVILRAVLTVILLMLGKGILGMAIAELLAIIIEFFISIIMYRLYAPDIQITLKSIKLKAFRVLIVYALIMILIKLSNLIRFNLDSLVIGKLIGIDDIAIYRIAALLMTYLGSIIFSTMNVLSPRFSKLYGAGEHTKLKDLFLKSLSISSFISFGFILLAFILGGKFILFWVGEEFIDAIPVLWILIGAFAFELPQTPIGPLLKSYNKHYVIAVSQIIEAIANLIISVILAPRFGIIGVALGTAIPMIIVKIVVQPIYICKVIKLNILDFFKPILLHGLIVALFLSAAFMSGIIQNYYFLSWMNPLLYFIIVGVIVASIYIVISMLFMNKGDRSFLLSLIPGFKKKESISPGDKK